MRKMNKRGFTIVELVIVIAIIAVLAAVMIPTFSGVLGDAKDSAAVQGARAAYTQYLNDNADSDAPLKDDFIYVADGRWVVIKDGQIVEDPFESEADARAYVANDGDENTDDAATLIKDAEGKATTGVDGLYLYTETHTPVAEGGEG